MNSINNLQHNESLNLQPQDIFAIRVPHTAEDKIEQPGKDSPGLQYALTPLITDITQNNIDAKDFERDSILYAPLFRNEYTKNELVDKLIAQQPKYIFLSAVSAAQPYAYQIAEIIKEHLPNTTIIEGGRHIKETQHYLPTNKFGTNSIKSDIIDNFRHGSPIIDQLSNKVGDEITYLISGEGEYTLLALINLLEFARIHNLDQQQTFADAMKNGYFDNVKGIASIASVRNKINDKEILFAQVGKKKLSNDDIPSPYEYFTVKSRFSVFPKEDGDYKKTAHLMLERGCPYNCIYCSEALSSQGPLAKVLNDDFKKNVYHQVTKALFAGAESFFDDTPTFSRGDPKKAKAVAEVIAAIKQWGIPNNPQLKKQIDELERGMQITVNEIYKFDDAGIRQDLIDTGLTYVFLGIESLDPRVMENIQKEKYKNIALGNRTDKVENGLKILKNNSIKKVGASFQFGLPASNRNTRKFTIDKAQEFIENGLLDFASKNIVTLHPGTQIGEIDDKGKNIDYTKEPKYEYPFTQFDEAHPTNIVSGISPEDVIWIEEHTKKAWEGIEQTATLSRNTEQQGNTYEKIDEQRISTGFDIEKYRIGKDNETIYFNPAGLSIINRNVLTLTDTPNLIRNTRSKLGELVGLSEENTNQVVIARNTTDAMKFAYRLADIENNDEVVVAPNNFITSKNVFEQHRDFGNTNESNIGTTRGSERISEKYKGHNTVTTTHHTIIEASGGMNNLLEQITDKTKVVVIPHVSRTDGEVFNISAITKSIKKLYPNIIVLIDGAQAIGNLPKVDFNELQEAGIDFYAGATFHKRLGGDQGACLYVHHKHTDKYNKLEKLSAKEQIIFSGMIPDSNFTNVDEPLSNNRLISMLSAIYSLENQGLLSGNDFSEKINKLNILKNYFIEQLQQYDVDILSDGENYAPGILSFRFNNLPEGLNHQTFKSELYEKYDIECSYLGKPHDILRVSFETSNSKEQIDTFFEALSFFEIFATKNNKIISLRKWLSNQVHHIGNAVATIAIILGMIYLYFQKQDTGISSAEKDFLTTMTLTAQENIPHLLKEQDEYNAKNAGYKTRVAGPIIELEKKKILASLEDADTLQEAINSAIIIPTSNFWNNSELLAIEIAQKKHGIQII